MNKAMQNGLQIGENGFSVSKARVHLLIKIAELCVLLKQTCVVFHKDMVGQQGQDWHY